MMVSSVCFDCGIWWVVLGVLFVGLYMFCVYELLVLGIGFDCEDICVFVVW